MQRHTFLRRHWSIAWSRLHFSWYVTSDTLISPSTFLHLGEMTLPRTSLTHLLARFCPFVRRHATRPRWRRAAVG
eukprot:12936774-Prorocentrum_lima.AAC.1